VNSQLGAVLSTERRERPCCGQETALVARSFICRSSIHVRRFEPFVAVCFSPLALVLVLITVLEGPPQRGAESLPLLFVSSPWKTRTRARRG
jgi:hypothetical protein